MIHYRNIDRIFYGTLAEFNASTRIWKKGTIMVVTDTKQVRFGDGTSTFSQLPAAALT